MAHLVFSCRHTETLRYVETLGRYDPNPFEYRVIIINDGEGSAQNVRAELRLPPNVELATAGDSLVRAIGIIRPFSVTNTATEIVWMLRYIALPDAPERIALECTIDGQNEWDGSNLRQSRTNCSIDVEPVHLESPAVTMIPSEVSINDCGDGYSPDPLYIGFRFTNSEAAPLFVKRASVQYPSGDLTLVSPAEEDMILDTLLEKRASVTAFWKFHLAKAETERTLRVWILVEDTAGSVYSEYIDLAVPGIAREFIFLPSGEGYRAVFDPVNQRYEEEPLPVSVRFAARGWEHTNVRIALRLSPRIAEYYELDSSIPGNQNPRLYASPGTCDTVTAIWYLRMLKPNNTGVTESGTISFDASYDGATLPDVYTVPMTIDPANTVGINEIADTPELLLDAYPNPHDGRTKLTFVLRDGGFISLRIFDIMGRLVENAVGREFGPGEYSIKIGDGMNLPAVCFALLTVRNHTKAVMLMRGR